MPFHELYSLVCAPRLFLKSSPQLFCVCSIFIQQAAVLLRLNIFISHRAHAGVFLDSLGVVILAVVVD